ncbi:hypothetical protein M918_06635 [Clostridium sp. BL8]|nr:hypothetical protein M918_06635 [Clostridium sp. BL8]
MLTGINKIHKIFSEIISLKIKYAVFIKVAWILKNFFEIFFIALIFVASNGKSFSKKLKKTKIGVRHKVRFHLSYSPRLPKKPSYNYKKQKDYYFFVIILLYVLLLFNLLVIS